MNYGLDVPVPLSGMKKLHGTALEQVSLMNSVLVSKRKLSSRHLLLTVGFPSNPHMKLNPGDHLNIFPDNDGELVLSVIQRLTQVPSENEIVVWKGEHYGNWVTLIQQNLS